MRIEAVLVLNRDPHENIHGHGLRFYKSQVEDADLSQLLPDEWKACSSTLPLPEEDGNNFFDFFSSL